MLEAMAKAAASLKVGSPDDEGIMLGPIQNSMQYERVKGFFADSKAKGYKFAVGEPDVATSKGYFIQPTIIGVSDLDGLGEVDHLGEELLVDGLVDVDSLCGDTNLA